MIHLPPSRRIEHVMAAGFVVFLGAVLANAVLSYRSLRRVADFSQWVSHTQEVIIALETARDTLTDAETGQRAYLISGRASFLRPLFAAQNGLDAQIAHALDLTRDDPAQQVRLKELRTLAARRIALLGRGAALRHAGRLDAAHAMVGQGEGPGTMARAMALIIASRRSEENMLATRRSEWSAGYRSSLLAFIGMNLSFGAMLAVAYGVVRSVLRQRADAESRVGVAQQRLATTIRSIGDGVIATDAAGRATLLNPVAERLTGWAGTEAAEVSCEEVFCVVDEREHRPLPNPILSALSTREPATTDEPTLLVARDGTEIPVEQIASPVIDDQGVLLGTVLVFRDTSGRRAQELQLKTLNQRLQTMMAETHHRVKNNLQVISAMIDMQQMKHEEHIPVAEMARLSGHIRGLAAVHDLLTQRAKLDPTETEVSVKEAFEKLAPMIAPAGGTVRLHMTVEDARLPVRLGTSLAVLLNELVSNAVKHGGPDVEVAFAVREDRAILSVADNGPGFPEGFSARVAANTGLELVETVGRWDLQGDVRYTNRPQGGAVITVDFPLRSDHEAVQAVVHQPAG